MPSPSDRWSGLWRGTITKWSEIKDNGDKLSGTGCNPETPITHIVRFDGSGTTHIFKKYLGLINKTESFPTTNFKGDTASCTAKLGPEHTYDETNHVTTRAFAACMRTLKWYAY